jgi:hypothetical protein
MCQPEQPSAEAHIITVQYAELLESEDLTAQIAEVTRSDHFTSSNIIRHCFMHHVGIRNGMERPAVT